MWELQRKGKDVERCKLINVSLLSTCAMPNILAQTPGVLARHDLHSRSVQAFGSALVNMSADLELFWALTLGMLAYWDAVVECTCWFLTTCAFDKAFIAQVMPFQRHFARDTLPKLPVPRIGPIWKSAIVSCFEDRSCTALVSLIQMLCPMQGHLSQYQVCLLIASHLIIWSC